MIKRRMMTKLHTLPSKNVRGRVLRNEAMKKILIGLSVLALPASIVSAENEVSRPVHVVTSAEDAADSLYRLGRQAINDDNYERAIYLFRQVADKYPKSPSASEALYWRAWAAYQLGRDRHNKDYFASALQSIDQLQQNYPKANAVADARELRTRVRTEQANLGNSQAAGEIVSKAREMAQSASCSGADDEMRMAALQGLMSMNASDAIPILKQVLEQRDPCRVGLRKQAVYMIAQRRDDEVVRSLLDVARNDPSHEVQNDAVYWLSTTRSDRATGALDSILFQGRDTDLRNRAVYALSQVGTERASHALKRAAQDEKLPEDVRGQATYWLGNAKLADLEFFRSLYQSTKSSNVRGQIIQAVVGLHTADATLWLIDMAKNKTLDGESRKNAIYWIGQQRTVDMDQLNTIYEQARGDNEVQNQVIYVYSQRTESLAVDKLMAIAKSDPNIEMRKTALYWLQQKSDPRVMRFIRDLIMR
jgi:HEAT repeat protein